VTATWWVLVMAADGPVLVPHTEGDCRALWAGVDPEATRVMSEPLDLSGSGSRDHGSSR
jgi:hypothetical protein